MDAVISPGLFALAWLACMLVTLELGRRAGVRLFAKDPNREMAGMDMMGGAIFALCGLLIAFTLTGSTSRYDQRRMLIVEESNDIGTAYMRIDLLPDSAQPALRLLFRNYIDARLETYAKLPDVAAAKAEIKRSEAIQLDIWKRSIAATRDPAAHTDAAKLLIPALNDMIDITATRLMAARIHPPKTMYILLFILGLGCSLIAGIRMAAGKRRSWLHILVFAVVMSGCAYVILSIEYPRMSFIRLGEYDQVLIDLRDSMK